mgnify:CR=1 FL=1
MPVRSKTLTARRTLGLCLQCGSAAHGVRLCPLHLAADRDRKRSKGGFKAWQQGGPGRPWKSAKICVNTPAKSVFAKQLDLEEA